MITETDDAFIEKIIEIDSDPVLYHENAVGTLFCKQ